MTQTTSSPLEHSLFELIRQEITDVALVRCTKNILIHLSHTLEDTVLKNKIPAMLFTGFQESSHWAEETARYQELAKVAMQICIFAGKPFPPESQANQLHIELADGDPLRQEWFLLILSDSFSVLLCGQDTQMGASDDIDREFDTIWTFDAAKINRTLNILDEVIGHYRPERLASLQQARQTFTLNPPNETLLSQFVMDVLRYENTLNREIRQQTMLLETIMVNVGQYAYVIEGKLDGTSTLRFVSGNVDKLFGYDMAESEDAQYWFEKLVHPDDKARFYANQNTLQSNIFSSNEYRYIRQDGQIIRLRVTSQTIPNPDGYTRYGTFQDVTSLYDSERIHQENEKLARQLEQEKEINATRAYFINSVMHEFRNPLATILLASEMIERYSDKMSEAEKNNRLRIIQNQVMHLRTTLDDMTLIMNNELREMGFNPEPEDADIYFGGLLDRFRKGKGANHRVIIEDTLPKIPVLLDTRLLKYVIPALLSNAAQYSPRNSTIICRLYQDGDHLVFSVTDEGIGIPVDDQPNIFKPLFRARNVSPSHHGGGLGLTIAEECVTMHKGKIEFITQEGVGSTFMAILPYMPALS
jgi:PAS domain S-box-containing protein